MFFVKKSLIRSRYNNILTNPVIRPFELFKKSIYSEIADSAIGKIHFLDKHPVNPLLNFNFRRASSDVVAALQSSSFSPLAVFSAHNLNRYMDPVHSVLLIGLKS